MPSIARTSLPVIAIAVFICLFTPHSTCFAAPNTTGHDSRGGTQLVLEQRLALPELGSLAGGRLADIDGDGHDDLVIYGRNNLARWIELKGDILTEVRIFAGQLSDDTLLVDSNVDRCADLLKLEGRRLTVRSGQCDGAFAGPETLSEAPEGEWELFREIVSSRMEAPAIALLNENGDEVALLGLGSERSEERRWRRAKLNIPDRIIDLQPLDLDEHGEPELLALGIKRIFFGVMAESEELIFSDLPSGNHWQQQQWFRSGYDIVRLFPASLGGTASDLFGIGPDGLVALSRDGMRTAVARQWGLYPDKNVWQFHVVGDFDGNGRSDIASRSVSGTAWWVVLSGNETGYERPAGDNFSVSVPVASWKQLESVDLDNDAVDEIALLADEPPQLLIVRVAVDKHEVSRFEGLPTGPSPCNGYHALPMPRWNDLLLMKFEPANECARHHAFFAVADGSGRGSFFPLDATCCKLPAPDILLDRHVYLTAVYPSKNAICPDNHVLTMLHFNVHDKPVKYRIRCTAINSTRYRLGPETTGLYWGAGYSGGVGMQREQIPLALRFSLGRTGAEQWDGDGCVGYPWGSVLVARHGPKCEGLTFRQLQYRGLPGDPPEGTPVVTLPECSAVRGLFSPVPKCIGAAGSKELID